MIIIIRGPQGSGKTTLIKSLVEPHTIPAEHIPTTGKDVFHYCAINLQKEKKRIDSFVACMTPFQKLVIETQDLTSPVPDYNRKTLIFTLK